MNKVRPPRFSGMQEKVLLYASGAVERIDTGVCTLDEVLDHAPEDCRRALEHLLTCIYRYRKAIRGAWRKFCRKEPSAGVAALLDTALTQCRFQDGVEVYSTVNVAVTLARHEHADKFVNAVLRAALREEFVVPQKAQEILPDGILERWQREFPEETVEEFAGLFAGHPEFTFRLCRDVKAPSGSRMIRAYEPFRFAAGNPAVILKSGEFARGEYYIQDPAASMAVSLAKDVLIHTRKLLDICCAPGGKTLMAAELLPPGAEITAADISRSRQKLTRENFEKRKVQAQIITAEPADLTGSFDFVIADMPCSNSGVFRRRPDALWRFSEKSLADVMKLQQEILRHAARLTAPGGYLLISTCSIEKDENNALTELPGFIRISGAESLPSAEKDGAFAALMQKLPL